MHVFPKILIFLKLEFILTFQLYLFFPKQILLNNEPLSSWKYSNSSVQEACLQSRGCITEGD